MAKLDNERRSRDGLTMILGCRVCGFRSKERAFFRRERSGFLNLPQSLCAGCSAYRPSQDDRRVAAGFVVPQILWLPVIAYAFDDSRIQGFSMMVALVVSLATLPLRVTIHELGHAWIGRLVGSGGVFITVGGGPRRRSLRFMGIRIDLHRHAFFGGLTTHLAPPRSILRWREAAILVAGSGANLASAALATGLAFAIETSDAWAAQLVLGGLAGFIVSSVWMAALNLVPLKAQYGSDLPTDGRKLLQLLRPKPIATADDDAVATTYVLLKAGCWDAAASAALAAAQTSPNALYLWSAGLHALSRARGHPASVDHFLLHRDEIERAAQQDPADGPRMLAWIQGTIAWSALQSGDPARRALADELSYLAAESAPDGAELQATRGAWLIASEHTAAGVGLLEAVVCNISDPIDKADFCGVLARGWQALGDNDRASAFQGLKTYLSARHPV